MRNKYARYARVRKYVGIGFHYIIAEWRAALHKSIVVVDKSNGIVGVARNTSQTCHSASRT